MRKTLLMTNYEQMLTREVDAMRAERDALAAQLAEARAALGVIRASTVFKRDAPQWGLADYQNAVQQCMVIALDALDKPAPHADLIAAGMAVAEAQCGGKGTAGDALVTLCAACDAYRAAKEAADV